MVDLVRGFREHMPPFRPPETLYKIRPFEWNDELFKILDWDVLIPRDFGDADGASSIILGELEHQSRSVTSSGRKFHCPAFVDQNNQQYYTIIKGVGRQDKHKRLRLYSKGIK